MKVFGLIAGLLLTAQIALGVEATYLAPEHHISGPSYTIDDLQGRVIAVESWGKDCPPCRASLPHMAKLAKGLAKDPRVVFIGAHVQRRDDAAILKLLSDNKCDYAVYQFFGIVGVDQPNYIPFAYVIDHTGKTVYTGAPDEAFAKAINTALKAAPTIVEGSLVQGLTLRYYKDAAKQLVEGKNIERYMKLLEAGAQTTGEKQEEAKMLLARCNDWIAKQSAEIDTELESYPSKALARLQKFAKTVPSQATQYKEQFTKLSQDTLTKRLSESRKMYEKLSKANASSKRARSQLLSSAKGQLRQLSTLTTEAVNEDLKNVTECWNAFVEGLSEETSK